MILHSFAWVQRAYSSFGLAGAFVGANGFSVLYDLDYRLPLFTMGVVFAVCVLIGGALVRISESRRLVSDPHPAPPVPAPTTCRGDAAQATYPAARKLSLSS